VDVTEGPDLAQTLHRVWPAIESQASELDGLCRQLARVTFEVLHDERMLVACIPVADTGESLRIFMNGEEVRFFLDRGGVLISIDPQEPQLDRAVFLILAELAQQRNERVRPVRDPLQLCDTYQKGRTPNGFSTPQ